MYTTTLNIDNFLNDSQRPADMVMSGRKFYDAIRKGTNSFVAAIFLVLALPFAWAWVYKYRCRLQKHVLQGFKFKNDNYAQMRSAHDVLSTIVSSLQIIQAANIQAVPFWLRGFIREIQCFLGVICQANDGIKVALLKMDSDYSASKIDVFQPISDTLLWQNRPKVYQYRI